MAFSWTNKQNDVDIIDASDINSIANEIVSLETTIPSTYATKTELDEKQDTLTFDNTPTVNSNNPVKSGGVYNALASVVTNVGQTYATKTELATKADKEQWEKVIEITTTEDLSTFSQSFDKQYQKLFIKIYLNGVYTSSTMTNLYFKQKTVGDATYLTSGDIGASDTRCFHILVGFAPDGTINSKGSYQLGAHYKNSTSYDTYGVYTTQKYFNNFNFVTASTTKPLLAGAKIIVWGCK